MVLSRTPAEVTRPGSERGADNDVVLRRILEYSDEQVAALRARSAVIDPDDQGTPRATKR
jgi:crotonobetainyl-CoA:carnitine CoA-transferase CaiB-like acyl-CoA transferase